MKNFARFKSKVIEMEKMTEVDFGRIVFLQFMATENKASINFDEGGSTMFESINPEARLKNPQYEPVSHVITAELEHVALTKSNKKVQVEIQYKKQTAQDDSVDNSMKFEVDDSAAMLTLDLSRLHPKMEEGEMYTAKARWIIRFFFSYFENISKLLFVSDLDSLELGLK